MKGDSYRVNWKLPKRLRSLMIIVAVSALTFQMIRGIANKPATAPAPARFSVRFAVASQSGDLDGLLGRHLAAPPALEPLEARPFFLDGGHDDAMLKSAPEGIDDAMIHNPQLIRK